MDAPRTTPAITLVAHEISDGGGMERQLTKLAEGLLAAGHQVTVIAGRCDLEAQPGLRYVRVRGPRRPFAFAYPWFFLVGSFQTARHRCGLVHTTGAIVVNRADASTIHFCHHAFSRHADSGGRAKRDTKLHRLNSRIASRLSLIAERLCYRPGRTSALVAVSAGVKRELQREFPDMADRVRVIVNGVDLERFRPDDDLRQRIRERFRLGSDLVLVFVGGEWERKGLRYAIEALAHAPGWRLLVAGNGDVGRYGEVARRAEVFERVHFAGHVPEVAAVYAAADAFALPTTYEAFPLVSLEAAAAGLPLLITQVSGVEDLIEEGSNGWFVERDAGSIAERLRPLADPQLRERLARSARESARMYAWDAVIKRYLDLYDELPEREGLPGS
jgi:UDP-glucose:(heptosyl)LPS alpha-1,3-glucosyltransferase